MKVEKNMSDSSEPIEYSIRELFSKQYIALFENTPPELFQSVGLALPPDRLSVFSSSSGPEQPMSQ